MAFVVSADDAPTRLAPWRTATVTVLYTDLPLDLSPAGFVPTAAPGEATLIVRQVSDRSLLEPWPFAPGGAPPLAHPLQQIWDLHHLGGEDRAEAAARLVDYTRHHLQWVVGR